jgi:branched-chain amino acid transport system permease protein
VTVHLTFLVVGLGLGAVYASLALGLVLIYKGTGVVNFAMGAMAMWGAFVYDELRKSGDFVFLAGRVHLTDSPPVAVVLGILSSAALGGLAHLLVFQPLRRAPALAKVVASLGLFVTLQALVAIRFGSTPRTVAPLLPTSTVSLGDMVFSVDRVFLTALVILLGAGVWAVLRFTRLSRAPSPSAPLRRQRSIRPATRCMSYRPSPPRCSDSSLRWGWRWRRVSRSVPCSPSSPTSAANRGGRHGRRPGSTTSFRS